MAIRCKIKLISTKICISIFCFNSIYSLGQELTSIEIKYPIIPTPQEISYGEREIVFNSFDIIQSDFNAETKQLRAFFNEMGIEESPKGIKIQIIRETTTSNNANEAYKLNIDAGIIIWSKTNKGAFYGIQTLRQILRKKGNNFLFPELKISDWPAFKVRGFMHDTGRNFQSLQQLKEQIEVLAQYKYNVFHWHLTDNPGWRLESKRYPELQSEEATSRGKGKFYTQQDFKDLLAFCKVRNITVVPEFDIPGHSGAFRKAFKIDRMSDPRVKSILLNLFHELMELADAYEMPYIHIGTDEVRNNSESVSSDVILEIMDLIRANDREVIVWKEGIEVIEDSTSINQLWAQNEPQKGHRFIDSRANYINHLDPFAGMSRLYFQQPCRQPKGDSLALGGILCTWPDNNVSEERDILRQNPIYPAMVFYSDAIWKGRIKDHYEYWAKLPPSSTFEFNCFKAFESKVIAHRKLFFQGKEFPYVEQTNILWKIIGPFDNKGDVIKSFPTETSIKHFYNVEGENFDWKDSIVGATIHLNHFFGFPSLTNEKSGTFYAYTQIYSPENRIQDFWIGFQGWSRSGRRGGPTPDIGQWGTAYPKVWVNNSEIAPPIWKQPGLGVKNVEIPFLDEDYFYREPTKVHLRKGWNKVLLKIPNGGNLWKWMFTCVPIKIDGIGVSEVTDLKFSTNLFDN